MKVTHTAISPPTGKRMGIVYNTVGTTFTARARALPVLPRGAAAVATTLAVSTSAAAWLALTAFEKSAWENPLITAVSAYNYFVKLNALQVQWGLPTWVLPPPFLSGGPVPVIGLYSEPDGVHTTLIITGGLLDHLGQQGYVQLYLQIYPSVGRPILKQPSFGFVGTFAMSTTNGPVYYDLTDWMTRNQGRWLYPSSTDLASEVGCGAQGNAQFYLTNVIGQQYGDLGTQPFVQVAAGFSPVRIAAGLCPPGGSAPYPWPPSH
jgi:hypothetical protein